MAHHLYPDRADQRRATIARDVLAALLLVSFAVLAWVMFTLVDRVSVVAEGVQEAGTSVQDAFGQAAAAADGVPVIGGELADALTEAGGATGGRAVRLGEEGRQTIRRTALAVGLVTFVGPAGGLAALYLPVRWAQVRRLDAGRRIVADVDDPERRRLLAMRAAFTVPADRLVRHTADPMGDLATGRFDGLLAALYEDLGVQPGRR